MSTPTLRRGLSTLDAAAIVVGTVIGTGIFLKTATMSQVLGSPLYVMLAWVMAGLLSYAGALTYSELGSRFPEAGGEYIYLKEAYGGLVSFLYGWTRCFIGGPGSIAAYAVGTATFLGGVFQYQSAETQLYVAIALILIFTGLNCLAITIGGAIQTVLTILKILMVISIAFGIFFFGNQTSYSYWETANSSAIFPGLSAFGTALIAALWAYDGWNNLPMVGSEIKNAQKALPIALGLGMLGVGGAYLLANFSYFMALPFDQILTANSSSYPDALPVATLASQTFLGHSGVILMSVIFAISAIGAMHGSIMTSARVPYAMATQGSMPKILSFIGAKNQSPMASVIFQGMISIVLAFSGTFDQLTDAVVFSSWIFYALCAASLFKWRKQDKTKTFTGFKTPGYPLIPIVFVIVSTLLLMNTVITNPKPSLMGLGVILLGVPFYLFYFRFQPGNKHR
jgi:APA family basic amino acid/polyamine antiporter